MIYKIIEKTYSVEIFNIIPKIIEKVFSDISDDDKLNYPMAYLSYIYLYIFCIDSNYGKVILNDAKKFYAEI